MSCQICGLNVPASKEPEHDEYHMGNTYVMDSLLKRVEALENAPAPVVEEATEAPVVLPPEVDSPEVEAFWRDRISQELLGEIMAVDSPRPVDFRRVNRKDHRNREGMMAALLVVNPPK